MTVSQTPKISQKGKELLDAKLAEAVNDPLQPAQFFGVTSAEGPLYYNCGGDLVLGEPDKGQVNEDTILQLWSCTKLVTVCSVLQLVEKGIVSLDDPAIIEKTLPELCQLPVLTYTDAGEQLSKRKNPITLRHLLTHTSGLAYGELDPILNRYMTEHKIPPALSLATGIEGFLLPLAFEPGTRWTYGLGIDWAGFLLERLTGEKLGDYFQKNIFAPLGIKSISFIPQPDLKNQMGITGRDENGKLIKSPGLRGLDPSTVQIHSGGGGLLGTGKDYLRFLQAVLASKQPGGIISPESYKLLFTNQLPPREQGTKHYDDMKEFYDIWGTYDWNSDIGWGLGFSVNGKDSKYGRKAGSGTWLGICKTEYWLDPATGIAGFCGTQILSLVWPDAHAKVYTGFETAVYKALEA